VIVHWDKKAKELKMNAKTVMRVNHFYTHENQPRLTVQHFEPERLMKQKTYTDLKEWIGFNTPEVAPMTTVQAVDDVDTAAFSVDKPDVLDKLNAYCHGIANHQYINPYYPLNTLWRKLSLIGINFDLKSIMLNGASGRVTLPINQFGGRYGYVNPNPHDANVISHDDGISHKIPGGLELVITHQKTGGVYTLTAEIQHGSNKIGFGEEVNEELIHGKKLSPEQHKKVLSAYVHRHTGEHKPAWANKPMPNGNAYKPTHDTDKAWVHDHAFHFNKKTGNLSAKHKHAEPGYMAETVKKK
jgi:hypothetical protein